jgi:uncharacterized protein
MSTTELTPGSQVSARSGILTWITHHPVAAYFIGAFAGTWLLQLPILLGRDGFGLLPYSMPLIPYVILFLGCSFSGPTLAAILITRIIDGKLGLRAFFRRYTQWRVPWWIYPFVLFAFPLVYISAATIGMGHFPIEQLRAHWLSYFTTFLPALLIFPALITWGEEPGWRGFALTRLQQHYHPLLASLLVGLMHGLWHLPVFFIVNGPPALGPFNLQRFALNTLGIMLFTLIWTWVFNNARQSILIAVLLHASLNATQAWVGTLLPDFSNASDQIAWFIYLGGAILLLLLTRGRLGYQRQAIPLTAGEAQLPLDDA